jgi:hypothetical protein
MKTEKEIQTAWEICTLINRLSDLLRERYEEVFPDIDLHEQEDPCLGPLGPLGLIDTPDKTEGIFRIPPPTHTKIARKRTCKHK